MRSDPVIGLTLGEPAGIGPEVVAKALASGKLPRGFRYEIIGSAVGVQPGKLTAKSGRLALQALETAFQLWKNGELAAIVTGPVQKENLVKNGFMFPGQTEFFAARCQVPVNDAVMVLTDRKLTVALASTHVSLREAIRVLTTRKLLHVMREVAIFWQRTRRDPARMAVAGLNPHASENGLFGDEEARIVCPAIKLAQREGLHVSGPHAPDTIFRRATRGEFDAVVCLYHDQGLIPFKLLAFSSGVNLTLGLPLIRTSPDHGTALNLAGKNQADPRSMIAAIRLACACVRARQKDIAPRRRFVIHPPIP